MLVSMLIPHLRQDPNSNQRPQTQQEHAKDQELLESQLRSLEAAHSQLLIKRSRLLTQIEEVRRRQEERLQRQQERGAAESGPAIGSGSGREHR